MSRLSKKSKKKIVYDILRINISDVKSECFFQSPAWAKLKSEFKWEAVFFRQSRYPQLVDDILILIKRVRFLGYLIYVPDGLIKEKVDFKCLECASDVLLDIANMVTHAYGKKVFSLRWDIPWKIQYSDEKLQEGTSESNISITNFLKNFKSKKGRVKKSVHVQPSATSIVDLSLSEEELLAKMKSKTRYNIRLAKKKGVSITESNTIDDFYRLYQQTSSRNKIAIHSKKYYQRVVENAKQGGAYNCSSDVKIYNAVFSNEVIASIIVVYYTNAHNLADTTALYLYGASSNEHRNVMPAYLLQWHAMCEAKNKGYIKYDFFGIPKIFDKNSKNKIKDASMTGLYQFKIGFGGNIYYRLACLEYVRKGILTYWINKLFCIVEKMRMWYFLRIKKK